MNRGEEFSRKFHADFFETSAANDLNVTVAFEKLIEKLLVDDDDDDESMCFRSCSCQ
jgi:hypothetical protein